jgi:hypothetical protein
MYSDASGDMHNTHSPRPETFDEEAATGMPSSYSELNRAQSSTAAFGRQETQLGQSQEWLAQKAGEREWKLLCLFL